MADEQLDTYWKMVWRRFIRHRIGLAALVVILLYVIVGIYAPFLASSKPLFVMFKEQFYFPLFRYLFYPGFFTKPLDLFFNLLIFTFPILVITWYALRQWQKARALALGAIILGHLLLFAYIMFVPPKDPTSNPKLDRQRQQAIEKEVQTGQLILPNWDFELRFMTPYDQLNLLLRYQQRMRQHQALLPFSEEYIETAKTLSESMPPLPTLWQEERDNEELILSQNRTRLAELDAKGLIHSNEYRIAQARIDYILEKRKWVETNLKQLKYEVMPLLSHFHWEDDAGGQQVLNIYVPWWQLTRINRKDLLAALIFGVRISIVVGMASVALALAIGIPVGALAGFYGGTFDIIACRWLEIWESMPTFFMLLMVIAIMQSKSIFLVITAIGLFGWTGFSRYIRGEFFKQRNLSYVEACRALGFRDSYIIFKHILPNAIPPVLTLLPFAVMGAITSEAGLSFLGLGEEGSCSWGVLMDEGRTAFPEESYLMWPPAILLTILLIAIAMVGDALRDTLDPKLHK